MEIEQDGRDTRTPYPFDLDRLFRVALDDVHRRLRFERSEFEELRRLQLEQARQLKEAV